MNKIYLDHVSYVYSAGTPYEQVALDDAGDVLVVRLTRTPTNSAKTAVLHESRALRQQIRRWQQRKQPSQKKHLPCRDRK